MRRATSPVALALCALASAAGCGAQDSEAASQGGAIADSTIAITFDYAGAEALLAALERDSLSSADVDSLLRVHGVRAMVDNVTRFIPDVGEPHFRSAVQSFARTKQRPDGEKERYFQLDDAWGNRDNVRGLVARLREGEAEIVRRIASSLAPWQPRTGPLAMTAYFVVGGVSTGFVPDTPGNTSIYANLAREQREGPVVANIAHEAYHVMQKAAQRRAGLVAVADSIESLPLPDRLLATVLAEGTARFVEDPGARHWRDTRAARMRETFAVFDTVLAGVRNGGMTWERAYERGFSGAERSRFYFMGLEMTKAIHRHCGQACVVSLFERPPIEFFRQYVRLYRENPELVGRFSPETEAFLESAPGRD
jgi:hypothetical protein